MAPIGPVAQEDRIDSLDALRGFALLGILPANVLVFGMHLAAGNDPTVAGGAAGLNLAAWALFRILIEGKMRCLFSMVFGAGVILLTSRAEQRSSTAAADIYYRRNLWLLLFGLAHGFLLFWGDILYPYGFCALVLFPFRKLSPKYLMLIGAFFIVFKAGWTAVDAFHQKELRQVAASAGPRQAEAKGQLESERKRRKPSPADLAKDAEPWRGSPVQVTIARAKAVAPWQATAIYDPANADILSMMFMGMALFKLGVFSAARSYRFYGALASAGFLFGLPLNAWILWFVWKSDYDRLAFVFTNIAYDVERLPIALGCTALLMVLCKAGSLLWITRRLAAIGQMALSNYVFQSVVCTLVFTGYGFGLYGKLERYQLYYVVAACWAASFALSSVWLRHYRFGPLEWCWRSLTYWKRQPMRIAASASRAIA